VRTLSASYASCIREGGGPIDVPRARLQHRAYVDALRDAGIDVEELPARDAMPDAIFVEDTAIVLGARALVTRPGAPARREEVASIADALARRVTVEWMTEPATLDGGDVLRCADTLLVGLSQRTNRAGLQQLTVFAAASGLTTIGIEVRRGLHLKSACSLAGSHALLVQPDVLDLAAIQSLELEHVVVPEPAGANVLAFMDRVLVSTAAPRTAELLAKRGLSPRLIDLSEIHAGDGALTCMSLRFANHGTWVT
jgi:dimethylargininase